MEPNGRLIMLSGPSCVGKGPLCNALQLFYPEIAQKLHKLVLYNSRAPRPGEIEGVDYYFRSADELKAMQSKDNFILLEVRGDLQGLDLDDLFQVLKRGEDVLFEGNPFIPQAIWNLPELFNIKMLKVFLSPLSGEEIMWYKKHGAKLPEMLSDIMRRKLLRRTKRQKGILSLQDLQNIEKRAGSAPLELQLAWQFDWVIPNHDGEDSENWNAFYFPIGDALKALLAFTAILEEKERIAHAEHWDYSLWPER